MNLYDWISIGSQIQTAFCLRPFASVPALPRAQYQLTPRQVVRVWFLQTQALVGNLNGLIADTGGMITFLSLTTVSIIHC